jgi:hypothetical protein
MLRPYFLRHRELLGGLCQAAWPTVREMMAAAAGQNLRPGMVAVVQTFGSKINFHPHVHGNREPRRVDEDGPVNSGALCGCEGGRVAAAAQSAFAASQGGSDRRGAHRSAALMEAQWILESTTR